MRRTAAAAPDRVALRTLKERLTYGELDRAVDRLAAGLWERGVRPGAALAGFFEKRLELPLVFLAAARLGAVFVPLPHRLSYGQLRPLVTAVRVGAFFTELDHLGLLSTLRPLLPPAAPLVVLRGDPPIKDYLRLADVASSTAAFPDPGDDPERVCYLNLTSGTTGRPKAAPTTHRNLGAATAGACGALGLTPGDVHLCLFAAYAHPHEIFARALWLGGTAVLHESMSPKALANIVEKAGVTCMMAVPPLYDVSLKPQLAARTYRLASLRLLEAGGMATPPRLVTEMRERFGMNVVPVWGSTETTGVALVGGPGTTPGLLDRPAPGFEMRLVAEDGSEVGPGACGDLTLSGAAVVSGYLDGPTDRLASGTFRTGDLARRTAGGIELLGRVDDMRKVGGLKVFPQEIEGHLEAHPAVREAAVVFREDRARGLAPVALVVVREGAEPPSLTDIKRHLRGRLPSGTLPRALEIVPSLPRLPSGKLDRKTIA